MIGVYLLKKDGEVIYVGQSMDVMTRIKSHKNKKDFDSYEIINCSTAILDATEEACILLYDTKQNKRRAEIKTGYKCPTKSVQISLSVRPVCADLVKRAAELEGVALREFIRDSVMKNVKRILGAKEVKKHARHLS